MANIMYGGTKTEMERLLADAEKLTGVKYDINNLDDVFNAIHVIQGELGLTGVAAEEAKHTLQGSFNAMKAAAEDFLGSLALGEDIKVPLTNLINTAGTFLIGNLLPMVGNILKALPEALVTAFSTLGPMMVEQGRSLMESLGVGLSESSPLNGFGQKMMENLAPVFETIKTGFGQFLTFLQTVGQAVMGVVEVVADGLTRLDFSGRANFAGAVMSALTSAFENLMAIVEPAISMLVDSFVNLWNAIQPVLSILAEALMPVFQILSSFIGGVVKGAILALVGTFDILSGVIQFLTPVINVLVSVLRFISPVLSKIAEWVGVVIGMFANFGQSGNGLKNILKSAWDNIKNAINAAIDMILHGVNAGIKVFTIYRKAGYDLKNAMMSVWRSITSTISGAVSTIGGYISNIKSLFNSLKNINLFSAGKSIINGFLNGLKSAWGAVKGFVGGIAGWIKAHKGPISYDKKLLIPAGKAIMGGLNVGLANQFKDVKDTVLAMAGEIYDGFDISPKPIKLVDDVDSFRRDLNNRVIDGNVSLEDDRRLRADKVDSALLEILTYLRLLVDKDSDVYIDGDKVSSILGYKIEELRARRDKYDKRRGGILV